MNEDSRYVIEQLEEGIKEAETVKTKTINILAALENKVEELEDGDVGNEDIRNEALESLVWK